MIEPYFKQRIRGKRLTFDTWKSPTPELTLADYALVEKESAAPNDRIALNEVADLKFHVQNVGIGIAEQVVVKVKNNQVGVRWLKKADEIGQKTSTLTFPKIDSGKHETISFTYHVNSEFTDRELRFEISATEKYGKYGFSETKKVAINKKLKPLGKITPVSIDDEVSLHESPRVEELTSLQHSSNRFIRPLLLALVCSGIVVAYIGFRKRKIQNNRR